MKQGKYDEAAIEQILQSLDTVQRAQAPDFFYTRLSARIGEVATAPVIRRPALVLSALILMLCMNIFVLLRGTAHSLTQVQETENETMQMVDAYGLNDASAFTKESDENK
jgi:hypothetical protein